MNELDIQALPLLPLTTGVVLPGMVVTLTIESDDARAALGATAEGDDSLLLTVPRIEGRYARVGVVAKIEDVGRMRNGVEAVVIRGLRRATVGLGVPGTGEATWVQIESAEEPVTDRAHELATEYRGAIEAITDARGVPAVAEFLRGVTDPGQLADTSGYSPDLSFEQKVDVLETLDVQARLEKVLRWAKETLAEVQVKERIRDEVAGSLEERQREMLLREQMAAIRKELGEDGTEDVLEEYRTKIADAGMSEDVRAQADRELGRLERTSEQSPEYGWIRTYLDWLLDVPWSSKTEDNLDIGSAREVLDADHEGLRDVKDRILEYLAVRKLRSERGLAETGGRGSGAILTLVGPPGVGKTSLGESVARALGRNFVRVSLGGVHDESEIRGHRRTYVGALPGRIVRALKDAGTKNPVMMLDEVDKVGADWRGDPSSALLEVLDPAQNHTFRDHYLDVDLDLSEVLFIATANVAETIAGPLLDRMEVIRIDGYTEDEKVAIARRHLLPRQVERNGLRPEEVEVTDDALRGVVGDYTREAGVRNLERELGKIMRKVATKLTAGEGGSSARVDATDLREYLGRQKFFFEAADRTAVPGVATGLAVTGTGGDVLFIEATREDVPETGMADGLTLTGQLGDVMKESARIALSYVRSHAEVLDIPADRLRGRFHVHVPAGAVPKDGPSAGVAMTTALASLLTGRPVRAEVGMTGEVTLQGRVLPIGGVKQKVLAAHRAGLKEVILPARNEGDLDDVPEQVREEMTFHLAEAVDDVLAIGLGSVADDVSGDPPRVA
ncbi:MAG TPA: endopeptidase La [Actinomycetota bacterium]|nr:endopeptidase La [Actinomycetota bacterium]